MPSFRCPAEETWEEVEVVGGGGGRGWKGRWWRRRVAAQGVGGTSRENKISNPT